MLGLPIDVTLPEILRTLKDRGSLVLEAPPGAGKTTRVPWAVLGLLQPPAEVWVTVPRRAAARMAALRVAGEHGEPVGQTVGYSVRFEEVAGPRTQLRYVTEGVLLRRLVGDPALRGIGAVILDEFHERHLTTDLLLVLTERIRETLRPDLRLVVMSATLDAERIAEHLGAPRVKSSGQVFPVSIEFLHQPDERPLEKQVASAVRDLSRLESQGDILVFLPGAPEIRRCQAALAALAIERDLAVLPLHGDLPLSEQVRAIEPGACRKLVLATNVAESSLTIEGVTAVLDSGLARIPDHSPWTGLPRLRTARISRASAVQRAGRAGRTRPGHVLRLYTRSDFESRPEYDLPEIVRADLCEAWLLMYGAGIQEPGRLRWLDAPPAASQAAAQDLLRQLGALDEEKGGLSELGQRLLPFPLHPRLGRLLCAGEDQGVSEQASWLAALLEERDILISNRTGFERGIEQTLALTSGPCDLLERLERLEQAEAEGFGPRILQDLGLEVRTSQAVLRAHKKLRRLARDRVAPPRAAEQRDQALRRSVLAGFVDRVARRRKPGQRDLILCNGETAKLAESSVVHDALLLVAVELEERSWGPGSPPAAPFQGGTRVRYATAVEPDWLLEYAGRIAVSEELIWNVQTERVERIERLAFGKVILEELRSAAEPSPAATTLLAQAAEAGAGELVSCDLGALEARLALLREQYPTAGFKVWDRTAYGSALRRACQGKVSLMELGEVDLGAVLLSDLTPPQRKLLEEQTPLRLRLASGRSVEIHYEPKKPPWLAARLQDFFGVVQSPSLCSGRVPITLHLLAPNQRAVQVTSDLAGFWQRHYPAIRRQLMRRYPKHAWPEDGRNATPPQAR